MKVAIGVVIIVILVAAAGLMLYAYVRALKVQVDMAREQYKDRASHRSALSAPTSYRGWHVFAGLAITFALILIGWVAISAL